MLVGSFPGENRKSQMTKSCEIGITVVFHTKNVSFLYFNEIHNSEGLKLGAVKKCLYFYTNRLNAVAGRLQTKYENKMFYRCRDLL